MKYIFKTFTMRALCIATVLVLFAVIRVHAQDHTPGDPDGAPIDGGLSVLIAGGAAYGIKKLRDNNKRK